jgi:hypothetical protein
MRNSHFIFILTVMLLLFNSCNTGPESHSKIEVLMDTDANNEIDDQHALAYLFFNGNTFSVAGITVNATQNGGNADLQYQEAERVMKLCKVHGKIPLYKGATGSFNEILPYIDEDSFDGSDAVKFIIDQSLMPRKTTLILLPVGKLTNIALALKKQPSIAQKVRIVWLGSNFPKPGEYNLENDTAALRYILSVDVPFEMVTVRWDTTTGSGYVKASRDEICKYMPGAGPAVDSVQGRHGGYFTCFGDYSVNLFSNCELSGDPPSRSLYDMTAVAILKNPQFGEKKIIDGFSYLNGEWVNTNQNRQILIWENFNRDSIINDFFHAFREPLIAEIP